MPPWCYPGCPTSPFLPPWCLPGCPIGPFLPGAPRFRGTDSSSKGPRGLATRVDSRFWTGAGFCLRFSIGPGGPPHTQTFNQSSLLSCARPQRQRRIAFRRLLVAQLCLSASPRRGVGIDHFAFPPWVYPPRSKLQWQPARCLAIRGLLNKGLLGRTA